MPKYAHIPFVAEPGTKNKLSKRKLTQYLNHREFKRLYESGVGIASRIGLSTDLESFNPVLVDFYRDIGFLPAAVINYLLLLGWSLDDKTEEFSREAMLEHFSLERVVKGEASFDPQKLLAFQQRYMDALPVKQKVAMCLPFLQGAGLVSNPADCDTGPYLTKIVTAAGDRICMAGDILKFDTFFIPDDRLQFDEKPFQKRLVKPDNAGFLLGEFKKLLATATDFNAEALEELLHGFCDSHGIGAGDIIHALRVAVTGRAAGFGMFDTMAILGQDRCVHRIQIALDALQEKMNNAV